MTEKPRGEAQRSGIVHCVAEPLAVAPHPFVGPEFIFRDQCEKVQDSAAIVAVIPSNNAVVGDLVLQNTSRQRSSSSGGCYLRRPHDAVPRRCRVPRHWRKRRA
jgi:hypothetical protein